MEKRGIQLEPIGIIRSPLKDPAQAPKQGSEAAVEGWLELEGAYRDGLLGLEPGRNVLILYWLDRADRNRLQVHPRGDTNRPLRGVFVTRSPHRPNPIAVETVQVLHVDGTRIRVRGLDALDGTPLLDIKVA
ncbi:tRNA-Thr(GGU) m(6)t(6)A37 methyltransferase TsaA [Desulfacinum hydrothermale DSM 13146]|uniref:tRNA-Thr(GGU) m(6)t(6)A37 methyltransferase TsaA n=1 Tax=Desulfacinum hydrothermale DSM 13146 TaxID=1121390 RepID=A0A1W1XTC0_9BACT|nr:tRNA (N6-threonylcarbamoyladenosine(37)-N6)-methyltransferase TrmO [Desulfacinum hydrothermale]SMC26791.1 tRNA-Thr(GGU) m(6)t(6)A37 methyltransferase TsaA [Desulfacinum hydrothermale DSM 13146]